QERPFTDFTDLLRRVRPEEGEAQALLDAGACDALANAKSRAQLRWELACVRRARRPPQKGETVADLFDDQVEAPDLPPDLAQERHQREFAVLGFLCKHHPLLFFRAALRGVQRVLAVDLPKFVGRKVWVVGWPITEKVVQTQK